MIKENKNKLKFVAVTLPLDIKDGILIDTHDINEIQTITDYINNNDIKKVSIQGCTNLDFLEKCKNIEFVDIRIPYQISAQEYMNKSYKMKEIHEEFLICDLTPLENLDKLKYLSVSTIEFPNLNISVSLDATKFSNLEYYAGEYKYIENSMKDLKSLKTLQANSFKSKHKNLSALCNLSNLESLNLISSNIQSLDGIEKLDKLKELALSYNRGLQNIDSLAHVSKSLCSLVLEKSAKIKRLEVLKELNNLVRLNLVGDNELEDLSFINNMPCLKTFIFEFNILNGNLDNCLNLSYVYSYINRKHYNLNDKDLPKIKFFKGNESIVDWLRLN
ncbi:MAG: internalin-A [Fusobacteria bacterium]|nr:MAG: internalin-A [Fusobacteriota bacterium]KAF0229293.1 MAG: hypothetical protein FD182_1549 [Fusobacteriota bacterium]